MTATDTTPTAIELFTWRALSYYDQTVPPSLFTGGGSTDPHINSLTPNSIPQGVAPVVVSVQGSKFVSGSEAEVDGVAQATTFVTAAHLTFPFTPDTVGEFVVTVRNPNDEESNDVVMTVTLVAQADEEQAADSQLSETEPEPEPEPEPELPEGPGAMKATKPAARTRKRT